MPESTEIRFLDRNVPRQPIDEVRAVAAEFWGLEGSFDPLSGERDQNFLIQTADTTRFVFKVANRDEVSDVVDLQVGALLHIAAQDPELPVPRVVPGLNGQAYRAVRFANSDEHIVYVLSYIDGVLLSNVAHDRNLALRRELGEFLARFDLALRGYFHPAAMQQHPWNMETCNRFQNLTRYLDDQQQKRDVDDVLDDMSATILPRLKSLRHQVIHQDAHGENVLAGTRGRHGIAGLIDFGDLVFGTLAAEIAVACEEIPGDSIDIVTPACELIAGFDSVLPLEESELDVVFDLIRARSALTATVMAARAAREPERCAEVDKPLPSIERLRTLNGIGRREFNRRLRNACRFPVSCPSTESEAASADEEAGLVAARHALMGRKTTHFYARPMHFERARGPWLYSTDGHRYLDCYNNVPQLGHSHPHIVRAISRQAATLNTNTRYLYSSALEYADRLTDKLAPHLTSCIFVNSGSEANDVAWQIAKLVTGKSGAIIMEDAYHGVTDVIRQFSPGKPGVELPSFLKGLIVPDPYRGPFREDDPDLVRNYAADADRAIAELDESGHGVAAFMIDSALCSSGVPDVPAGYMRAVEEKIRASGGLMICDEVQSGFGRMGQWWGHEHHGMRADIVTMGKPVGNGHPLGVVVTTDEYLNRFIDETRLFSTFGGNTVACAAGNAVLDVIEQEDLIERSKLVGDYLRAEITRLASKQDLIGNVRGTGMVTGLEFVTDRTTRSPATKETARLLELMRENRVLVGSDGRDANVLKLRPPLIFQKPHVDKFIDALDHCLNSL